MHACIADPFNQVFSSVIAAYSDVTTTVADNAGDSLLETEKVLGSYAAIIQNLNVGYFWMLANCISSACYVCSFFSNCESGQGADRSTLGRC